MNKKYEIKSIQYFDGVPTYTVNYLKGIRGYTSKNRRIKAKKRRQLGKQLIFDIIENERLYE
jgi:hypothetical protein